MKEKNRIFLVLAACVLFLSGCNQTVENRVEQYRNADTSLLEGTDTTSEPVKEEATPTPNVTGNKMVPEVTPVKAEGVTKEAVECSVNEILSEDERKCYLEVVGLDGNGQSVWNWQSEYYEKSKEPLPVYVTENLYGITYICVEGVITAVEVATGNVLWVNRDIAGTAGNNVTGYTTYMDGNLYVCSYYGPDFMEIDHSGKTVKRIDHLLGEDYFWPVSMDTDQSDRWVTVFYKDRTEVAKINLIYYTILMDTKEYEG